MNSSFIKRLLIGYLKFLRKNYFFTLLCLYFFYLIFLIFRTSFFIDGQIYFSLFDDEMVSMRYAKNLALGNGLVWNIGERIEGFSNPLWTIYMSFFHLLNIPSNLVSLPIQLTNVLFLILNLIFVKKIAEFVSNKNILVVFLAVFFTAFYFPLNNWAILGTETTPLMLITTISAYFLVRKTFNIYAFLILALGILIRLDFVLIYGAFLVLTFFYLKQKRIFLEGLIVLSMVLLGQFIFRFIYFNEFLPNTYYLKMTGFPILFRITRGIFVFIQFLISSGIIFVIPFLFIFREKKISLLLLFLIGVQVLYSIYAGGDVWEYFGGTNRYLSIVMPLYFVLFSLMIYRFKAVLLKNKYNTVAAGSLIFIYLFVLNSSNSSMLRDSLGLSNNQVVGANKINIEKSIMINKIAKPGSSVAVEWAGTTPYFSNEMYFIDILGKNDKYIARLNSDNYLNLSEESRFVNYHPGHTKWDYNYSIIDKKPDIIAQLPNDYEALQFVEKYYGEIKREHLVMHYRFNSKNIDLSKIK